MRMVGHLNGESGARVFSDYLYAQGIDNQIEPERGGAWAVWVHEEDQVEAARTLLAQYQADPRAAKYQQAAPVAEEKRRQEQEAEAAARRRFFDARHIFPSRVYGLGRVTVGLMGICLIVAVVSQLGGNLRPILGLFISEYVVQGGPIERMAGLTEIRHGQVWRLFTPMFVHFGLLHLLFNLLWLKDLGSLIEHSQGWRHLLLLVLVIAGLSNFAQYVVSGPTFGGMSGVVYGLLGFVWLRGKFDPRSGLHVDRQTVVMMVIWFFLCLVGLIPHVANTVHGVGFGVGLIWGYVSAQLARPRP